MEKDKIIGKGFDTMIFLTKYNNEYLAYKQF